MPIVSANETALEDELRLVHDAGVNLITPKLPHGNGGGNPGFLELKTAWQIEGDLVLVDSRITEINRIFPFLHRKARRYVLLEEAGREEQPFAGPLGVAGHLNVTSIDQRLLRVVHIIDLNIRDLSTYSLWPLIPNISRKIRRSYNGWCWI